jgi:hypothetical protein
LYDDYFATPISSMTEHLSRRRLLAIMGAAGSTATLGLLAPARSGLAANAAPASPDPAPASQDAATALPVDEKDSLAVALGYVADAKLVDAKANPQYQQGASCSGCSWYQGTPADATAPCTFFPGKRVNGQGWCRMWNKKT